MSWRHDAACRGMDVDLFFPHDNDWREAEHGKAVCAVCPVADECLGENLYEPYGVFGGTTPVERRALRRRLGLRQPQPEARHGTQSRYIHHKCRCGACQAAQNLANRLCAERRPRSACA